MCLATDNSRIIASMVMSGQDQSEVATLKLFLNDKTALVDKLRSRCACMNLLYYVQSVLSWIH
jgi:hypothetical protein